jgi:hypothetical protein
MVRNINSRNIYPTLTFTLSTPNLLTYPYPLSALSLLTLSSSASDPHASSRASFESPPVSAAAFALWRSPALRARAPPARASRFHGTPYRRVRPSVLVRSTGACRASSSCITPSAERGARDGARRTRLCRLPSHHSLSVRRAVRFATRVRANVSTVLLCLPRLLLCTSPATATRCARCLHGPSCTPSSVGRASAN